MKDTKIWCNGLKTKKTEIDRNCALIQIVSICSRQSMTFIIGNILHWVENTAGKGDQHFSLFLPCFQRFLLLFRPWFSQTSSLSLLKPGVI